MFLPLSFKLPTFDNINFSLEPLIVGDLEADYKLVMANLKAIKRQGGAEIPEDLTLEEDAIDLGWHQREFEYRTSFAYKIIDKSTDDYIGCLYLYSPEKTFVYTRLPEDYNQFDATISYWTNEAAYDNGCYEVIGKLIHEWIISEWPFQSFYVLNKILPKGIERYTKREDV